MPTYSYECENYGHGLSMFQGMPDPSMETCPECIGAVQRLIGTGAGILFKKSGAVPTTPPDIRPSCGRDAPCCGRSTPCETTPCNK